MSMYSQGAAGLLQPLAQWLEDGSVSEILLNKPKEIWVERGAALTQHAAPALDATHLNQVFQLIANENGQVLNPQNPLLSGSLNDGTRVQLCLPPTARAHTLSFRRKVLRKLTLKDYDAMQFYQEAKPAVMSSSAKDMPESEQVLSKLYHARAWGDFIKRAIELKKNIIISGGTSSGKTTYLNACLQHIPQDERIITLEDTREIETSHLNQVNLLASKGEQGAAKVTLQDLVQCCLRLRPDRIIMGEIRGKEILDFISACSTGHEGSLTSIHANNPKIAMMRMVQMVKLNNVPSMTDADILRELNAVVDIIVQLGKTKRGRCVQSIYYKEAAILS